MTDGSVELEVVSPGALASLQDLGRRGHRRIGVPWSGVLDARLMRLANALAGREGDEPVIEAFDGGLQLAARGGPVRVAVAGDAELEVVQGGQRRRLEAWTSCTLQDGDSLKLARLRRGRLAVVAVEGLVLAPTLGSCSTYARAAFGGLDGRALRAGDRLPARVASARHERLLPAPAPATAGPIRVVPGPQNDHFDAAALEALVASDYRVTAEADRMGVRLEGPVLTHVGAAEIVSDATVPGSIQVPGNGQPIVLLADAQTAGGYPKIGTVIGVDLARVADARAGSTLRFAFVSAEEGERLARAEAARQLAEQATLRPLLPGGVDPDALYGGNLVSGMLNALDSEHRSLEPGP